MRLAHFTVFVLASCSIAPAAPASGAAETHAPDLGLPAVRAPLEFPAGQEEVTLAWLLAELGRLTGQELSMDPGLRQQLEAAKEPFEIRSPVPAEEVYAFVEAMVLRENVFLAPLKGGTRPVLGVFGSARGQQTFNCAQAIPVTVARLGELDAHPAVLCQLVLHFDNIDTRQLQTQLRQLLVDNTGAQQVVPCGDRSLLIQGPGAKMAGLARLLAEVDRASAARPAPDAPATPAESPKPAVGPKPAQGPAGNG